MFEKIQSGQVPEQNIKEKGVLSGAELKLEDKDRTDNEDNTERFYTTSSKPKFEEIKNIDDAYKPSGEELIVAEDALRNSVLKNATLEDKDN